jgi:L-alanine-DL-glutamate epimerase-like enolase superfamily enzyme
MLASWLVLGFVGDVKLNFRRLDLQLTHPWAIARSGAASKAQVVVVELIGPDGTVGLGEAPTASRYKQSPHTVEAFLAKVDPRGLSFSDIPGSMRYLETLSAHDMSAKCALNVALLDGAARRARQPVHQMLGLGFLENLHVTSFSIGVDAPEVIQRKVREAEAYPVLKLKLGTEDDAALLRALREAAPAKPVRVDANEGWKSKEHALEQLEWLARDGHIQYVEQPLPATTPIKDWAWLKQRSPLAIFADESYHLAKDAAHAAECFHGVNVKLVKTGGLTAAKEALVAARKAGLKTMIGCMIETSILISAAAHLAELCDYLDLDGNLLISNDPFTGVTARNGVLSFAAAVEPCGLRVSQRGG